MGMITRETKSGFKFSVDAEAVKDMEFLELVGEAETNPTKLGKMYECLLGKDQKKKLYDHVRNNNGRVPIDLIKAESDDIFDAINNADETKN